MTCNQKLIVCSDGTWNDPEQLDRGSLVPTNVVKIARALALAKAQERIDNFYDIGLERWLGGLTGKCYQFIAEHYESGDKIYLFGFC